jgi:Zn-dependent protease with chaperone function
VDTILGALGYAAAAILVAPLLLVRGDWAVSRPRLALALWCAVFGSGLVALGTSLIWSMMLAVGLSETRPSGAGLEPTAMALLAWIGLVSFGGIASLVISSFGPLGTVRRTTDAHLTLLEAATRYRSDTAGGIQVAFIDCDLPFAASVGGPSRRIVVTSTLEDELDADELHAVIEHERAHLVQHHHRVSQLTQLNLHCLPRLPGAREFDRAARLLIELIADDTAARVCGRDVVARTLVKLGRLQQSESMLLRARRMAQLVPRGALRVSQGVLHDVEYRTE